MGLGRQQLGALHVGKCKSDHAGDFRFDAVAMRKSDWTQALGARFFGAGRVLVCAYDGGIEEDFLKLASFANSAKIRCQTPRSLPCEAFADSRDSQHQFDDCLSR
jgi:hypothetical protein